MKEARRGRRWGAALPLLPSALALLIYLPPLVLLCLFLADGRFIERLATTGTDARPLGQAQMWVSDSPDASPPPRLADAKDGVLDPDRIWKPVALPHGEVENLDTTSPLAAPPPESGPKVVWYRIPLGEPSPSSVPIQIYVPRIFALGTSAIYLDGRLAWRQPDTPLMAPFYNPILLEAFPDADAPRQEMFVRIATRAKDGSALSAPWISRSGALTRAYGLRALFQSGLVSTTWVAYWCAGAMAFLIYFWRLRKPDGELYLRFTLLALLAPTVMTGYTHFDVVASHQILFIWIALIGPLPVTYYSILLYQVLLGVPRAPAIGVVRAVFAALALLISARIGLCVYEGALADIKDSLVQLVIVPTAVQLAYILYFFLRRPGALSMAIAVMNGLIVLSAIHDTYLASHVRYFDDLFYLTVLFVITLPVYLFVIAKMFARSIDVAESLHSVVQNALAQKEVELRLEHEARLQIANQQTVSLERERMMQEMHDGIGSSLISALFYLRNGERDSADAARVLEECIDELKISIDSLDVSEGGVTSLLSSLRYRLEPRLRDRGLKLSWGVDETPPLDWLDGKGRLHVLRILQEILTNLMKHSDADALRIWTQVRPHEGAEGVAIYVDDNGALFHAPPPDTISLARQGIGNVISRTRRLNGRCDWELLPDGNRFVLWLPIVNNSTV